MLQKKAIAKEETIEALNKAERKIWIWCIILTIIFIFAWPLLALLAGVFPKVQSAMTQANSAVIMSVLVRTDIIVIIVVVVMTLISIIMITIVKVIAISSLQESWTRQHCKKSRCCSVHVMHVNS